jgi:glycine cleavage system aminomethyltransferase T
MRALFGNAIEKLKYFWLIETALDDIPVVVSRTGWSSERGYGNRLTSR